MKTNTIDSSMCYLSVHAKVAALACALFPLASLAGCGGADSGARPAATAGTPLAKDGLMDLHNLLVEIRAAGGTLPAKPSDFVIHDVVHPAAGALAANGTIVYLYGATVDAAITPPKLVAMQAGADQSGGWVLLSDGEIKDLPAEEVAALPPGGKMPSKSR